MSSYTAKTSGPPKKRSHELIDEDSSPSGQVTGVSARRGTNAPRKQGGPTGKGSQIYEKAVTLNGDILFKIQQLDAFPRQQLNFNDLIQRGMANARREGLTTLYDKLCQLQKAHLVFEDLEANNIWLRENHIYNDMHSEGEEALKLFSALGPGTSLQLLWEYTHSANVALNVLKNQQYMANTAALGEAAILVKGHIEMAREVLGKSEDDEAGQMHVYMNDEVKLRRAINATDALLIKMVTDAQSSRHLTVLEHRLKAVVEERDRGKEVEGAKEVKGKEVDRNN